MLSGGQEGEGPVITQIKVRVFAEQPRGERSKTYGAIPTSHPGHLSQEPGSSAFFKTIYLTNFNSAKVCVRRLGRGHPPGVNMEPPRIREGKLVAQLARGRA